jgi:hypothetical protein
MLSNSDRIRKGSTEAALAENNPDSQERGTVELSESAKRYEEVIKAALLAELATKSEVGDGSPRARRGKSKDALAAQGDYEEPGVDFVDRVLVQEPAEPEAVVADPVAPVDPTTFSTVIDSLAELRRAREIEKAESKKVFEAEESRLLAERDKAQREMEQARQAEARRGLSGQIAAMRGQAASEIPADPADQRSDYHKKVVVQIETALATVKDTQAGLTAFAKTTLPSLRQIAALGENDVPLSWQAHHRARLLGLAQTAEKVISEHRGDTEQCARVVRQAEMLLTQEHLDGEDADVRTKVNGLLRDLGYAGQGKVEAIVNRADNVVTGFAQVRKDGDEFKNPGTVTITLTPPDKGRDALRRGRHHEFAERDPKPPAGPLDSLGIDTSRPPII